MPATFVRPLTTKVVPDGQRRLDYSGKRVTTEERDEYRKRAEAYLRTLQLADQEDVADNPLVVRKLQRLKVMPRGNKGPLGRANVGRQPVE